MNNHLTNIKVDVQLQNSEAQFLDHIISVYQKENKSPKETIEFLLKIGLMYAHGYFMGKAVNNVFENINTSLIGKFNQVPENTIAISRIFMDDKPINFSLDKSGEVVYIESNDKKEKHNFYFLKDNQPLKWRKE